LTLGFACLGGRGVAQQARNAPAFHSRAGSPTMSDVPNAGFGYLEVRCHGCDTHQTIALDVIRRPKTTPVHELKRYMRCKDCSQLRNVKYGTTLHRPPSFGYEQIERRNNG
jgi:hypothetical protein